MPPSFWLAPTHGQDWRDHNILEFVGWLTSHVRSEEWARRMDAVQNRFTAARERWIAGDSSPFDHQPDPIAWYVFQASAFATSRQDFFEPASFRIAPVFKQLGRLLTHLQAVRNIDQRLEKLLANGAHTDTALFELLVAGAYKCRGWRSVEFVPEQRGRFRTHDLYASSGRRAWSVECKRMTGRDYDLGESAQAEVLAAQVHQIARATRRWLLLDVDFHVELADVPLDYLQKHVLAYLEKPSPSTWNDAFGSGCVRDANTFFIAKVLENDLLYFGSSRMVELISGDYREGWDYSVRADWTHANEMPFYAESVHHASIVAWRSASEAAVRRKARHFRSAVGKAASQLSAAHPGVVHVAYETRGNSSVDGLLHKLNAKEMRTFESGSSRLRWVYASYLRPEHTTKRNESWAVSETSARYRIGRHRVREPLPNHLFMTELDGISGFHW